MLQGNGDANLDLVSADSLYSAISISLGNGDGTFQFATSFGTGANPISVALADLNGDNAPDLVSANFESEDLSVLLAR